MSSKIEPSLKQARHYLQDVKTSITAEISAYPTPISGCDAQFNHLLAQRQMVLNALDALSNPVFIPTPRTPTEFSGVESR